MANPYWLLDCTFIVTSLVLLSNSPIQFTLHLTSAFSLDSLFILFPSTMPTNTVYSNSELRFFRLAKGIVDHSNAALRNVFKQEWNYLYPSTPWQNNRTSGSYLLAKERPTSRLYDPAYSKDYQHIRDNLSCGDVEEWDVTTLVFALKYSDALSGIRFGYRWRRIQNAIYQILV